MPIATDDVGLRRYAVFSFVEDQHRENANSPAMRFPNYPSTAIHEVAAKLAHSENFLLKRLRTLERGVLNPFVDASFFASYQGMSEVAKAIDARDCINFYDKEIHLEKAVFEEVQMVDPKKDMIETPIDEEETTVKGPIQPATRNISGLHITPREDRLHKGYIVMAFKTLEHMDNREFVSRWKTWTGVRFICAQLPRQLGLKRIAFYRRLSETSAYTYILLIEISNLLCYAAQTLNLLDRIKLRLCGYVGVYREIEFKIDPVSANFLNMEPSEDDNNDDRPAISITNPPEFEEKLKTPAVEKTHFLTVPLPKLNDQQQTKTEANGNNKSVTDDKPFSFKLIEQMEGDDSNLLDYEKRFPGLYKKRQNTINNSNDNRYNNGQRSPIQPPRNPFEKSSLMANGNAMSYGTYESESNPLSTAYQSFNNPFEQRDMTANPSPFVYGGRIANANFGSNFKNPLEENSWVRDPKVPSELRSLVPISDAEEIVKKAQQSAYEKPNYNQPRAEELVKQSPPKDKQSAIVVNMDTSEKGPEESLKLNDLIKDVGDHQDNFNSPNYDRSEYRQKQQKEPQLSSSLISSINSVGASLLSSAKAKVAQTWPATEILQKNEADTRGSAESVRSNKSNKNPFLNDNIIATEQPLKAYVPYGYAEMNRANLSASYHEDNPKIFTKEESRQYGLQAPLETSESNMVSSYHSDVDRDDLGRSSFSRVLHQHPYTPYDPPKVEPSRAEQLDKLIAMLSPSTFYRDPMGRRSLGTREDELRDIQAVAMRDRHGSFDPKLRPQQIPREDLIRQLKQAKQIQSSYLSGRNYSSEDHYAPHKFPDVNPDATEFLQQMSSSYPPSDPSTNIFYPVEKSPIPMRPSRPIEPAQKARKSEVQPRPQQPKNIRPAPTVPPKTAQRSVKQTVSDPNRPKSSFSPVGTTVGGRKSSSPSPRNSRGPSPTRVAQRSTGATQSRSGPSPTISRRKK